VERCKQSTREKSKQTGICVYVERATAAAAKSESEKPNRNILGEKK
jgi:hypothetical protein